MKLDGTPPNNPFDLLIIPQRQVILTAPHLTSSEAQQVQQDWRAYGNTPPPMFENGKWLIAAAHDNGGTFQITSMMSIPRAAAYPQDSNAARAAS